jgi:hypothetical protein
MDIMIKKHPCFISLLGAAGIGIFVLFCSMTKAGTSEISANNIKFIIK